MQVTSSNCTDIMMLNPEQFKLATEEFKQLYKKQFGVELTEEEATRKAQGLLQLISISLDIAHE